MSISSVMDSIKNIFFLRAFEINRIELVSDILGGEPMLGRRGLKPTLNSFSTWDMSSDNAPDHRGRLNLLLNIFSLVDGRHRMEDIVKFLDCSYEDALSTIELLIKEGLIRNV